MAVRKPFGFEMIDIFPGCPCLSHGQKNAVLEALLGFLAPLDFMAAPAIRQAALHAPPQTQIW